MTPLPSVFAHWFEQKGWQLRDYQHTMLVEKDQHNCTLLIAPTGAGKTLSGFLPSLIELAEMSEGDELAETSEISEHAETKARIKQAKKVKEKLLSTNALNWLNMKKEDFI